MDHTPAEIVAYVFLDLAVIIVVARLMGRLAVKVGQPAVMGEIIAGILLGPTLLGALPGDLDTLLFPADVRPYLNVLAQLGLVLFMFLVGLEVDLSFIRGRERIAFSVSIASIVLPFALGFLLATLLHERHDVVGGEEVGFLPFALFPVALPRSWRERRPRQSRSNPPRRRCASTSRASTARWRRW